LENIIRRRIAFQRSLATSRRRLATYTHKWEKHTARMERFSHLPIDDVKHQKYQAREIEYRHKIQCLTSWVERYQQCITEKETVEIQTTRQIEEMEAMKNAYLIPLSSQVSETIPIMVRLLSGDFLEVMVDRAHPVAGFADQFAKQHGYHPIATGRMVFMVRTEEQGGEEKGKEEEQKQNVFWSPEERHPGKSVGDLLGTGASIPILYLFIRPVEDKESKEKALLLRKILYTLHRDASYSDETLFDLYSNWRLTANTMADSLNRYQKMFAFVSANEEIFPLLEGLRKEEQDRRMDLMAFRIFRERIRPRPRNLQNIEYEREWLRIALLRYGPTYIFRQSQLFFFLRNVTVEQLFQEGFTIQNMSPTWRYYRFLAEWDRYTQESDASDAMQE
jgi:hypothetical protein